MKGEPVNMKKLVLTRKKAAAIALSASAVLTLGASLAYFTDRADTTATGRAGTVAIDLASNVDLLSEDGKAILDPGDMNDASFTITNQGNKSIDVRETIVLSALDKNGSPLALTEVNGQAEYELYLASDVEADANGSYAPKAGAVPLAVRTADLSNGKITYAIPQYTLNGSSTGGRSAGVGFEKPAQNVGESDADYEARVAAAKAAYIADHVEDDTGRELESGVSSITHTSPFVLLFRGSSSNAFQGSSVTLDIRAEALQHRNTGNGTWETVRTETISIGGTNTSVVPVETAISSGNAASAG